MLNPCGSCPGLVYLIRCCCYMQQSSTHAVVSALEGDVELIGCPEERETVCNGTEHEYFHSCRLFCGLESPDLK